MTTFVLFLCLSLPFKLAVLTADYSSEKKSSELLSIPFKLKVLTTCPERNRTDIYLSIPFKLKVLTTYEVGNPSRLACHHLSSTNKLKDYSKKKSSD